MIEYETKDINVLQTRLLADADKIMTFIAILNDYIWNSMEKTEELLNNLDLDIVKLKV